MIQNHIIQLLLIFLLINGCNSTTHDLKLTGVITHPKEREVRLFINDSAYFAPLDSSNAFQFKLTLENPEYVRFSHGNESSLIYLIPNSNLELTVDTDFFDETIALTGSNAEPSTYLLKLYLLNEQLPSIYDHTHLPPDAFINMLDSVISVKSALLDEQENLSNEFIQIEQDKLIYEKKAMIGSYLFYDEYGEIEIPDDLYTFNIDIDFNREDLISYYGYIDLLYREISTQAKEGNYSYKAFTKYPNFYNDFLYIADSTIQNEKVLAEVIQYHLRGAKLKMDIKDLEYHLNRYTPILPKEFTKSLKADIVKLKAIDPGSQVPNFTFYTLEDDSVSLNDFQGNLVYIDLWATWCKPCIAEQPMMERLIEEFRDEPVAFLSISIDASPEPWKKMVTEKQLAGTHLFAREAWSAEIMKYFVVMGIPHYILLDRDGKIIDKNTLHPSQAIDQLIRKHLSKT